jgi:hypothetical protein
MLRSREEIARESAEVSMDYFKTHFYVFSQLRQTVRRDAEYGGFTRKDSMMKERWMRENVFQNVLIVVNFGAPLIIRGLCRKTITIGLEGKWTWDCVTRE